MSLAKDIARKTLMKQTIFICALWLSFSSVYAVEVKKDFHLACKGTLIYEATNKPISVESSFYFSQSIVEHNGLPFRICSESSSSITFANDCSKQTIVGDFSVALRTIRLQVLTPSIDASSASYSCLERPPLR